MPECAGSNSRAQQTQVQPMSRASRGQEDNQEKSLGPGTGDSANSGEISGSGYW